MKKILFCANQNPGYRKPFFSLLKKKIESEGDSVDILFTHEKDKTKKIKGIGYKRFKVFPSIWNLPKKYDLVIFLPTDALQIIDNFFLFLSCQIHDTPYILWNERWSYKHTPWQDKMCLPFYTSLYQKSTAVVVSGVKAKEWVLQRGINEKKIFKAPNASEITFDKKEQQTKASDLQKKYHLKGKKVILYLGRLIKRKGIMYLLEAFSRIKDKDARLVIVGGEDFYNLGAEDLTQDVKSFIQERGLDKKVIMTGHIPFEDVPSYYLIADLFVLPSITEKIGEAWALVHNEAMQFGLPVISTDAVGAAYDLIEEPKNGYMVPEKGASSLQKAIETILSNPKRKDMGKYSKHIIDQHFTYEKMVDGFLKAIGD